MQLLSSIKKNVVLIPGWRTKRKIVVFESDDWGTIRIPNQQTLKSLSKNNIALQNDRICQFDSLETDEDLSALFEVLHSVKDSNRKPAVLTANTIVANPHFDRIALSDFSEYHYERFTDTIQRYPKCNNVKEIIDQGIASEIYKPQFHGREHLNVNQWLKALKKGNKELREAFKYQVFGIPFRDKSAMRRNIVSAFDYNKPEEMEQHKEILKDGLEIFADLFCFRSSSFIATTYVWNSAIEETLKKSGVNYLQGIAYQYIPNPGGTWYKKKFHYTGQSNSYQQRYLVRNCFFEPSLSRNTDEVGECLKRVEIAFRWNKPAIVSTHRVNFIGTLKEHNRTINLHGFKKLLTEIIKRWPDVEFMSSDQLGDLIESE